MISLNGHVLGVDVGFSPSKRSSAVCRLDWTAEGISWRIERYRAIEAERAAALSRVAGNAQLQAAAFDGPLRADLAEIGRYRAAERMLTRRLQPYIGKPGQASAPVGRRLNTAANDIAKLTLELGDVGAARADFRIHDRAIYEAFPSSFLGLMLPNPNMLTVRRGDRSDIYFQHATLTGLLARLFHRLLPGRKLQRDFASVTNHDDRAALVCAVTALCVAAGELTAVGDDDGWIVLPPQAFIAPWARKLLRENAREERGEGLRVITG